MDWSRLGTDINAQEFDHVFEIAADGRVVDGPTGVFGPERCEHDEADDMLIDGVPYMEHQEWAALTGLTHQYSYRGPVMHASEYVGQELARWLAEGYPRNTPFVMCPVEAEDEETGEDGEPAGWCILVRKNVAE
jgi:hypothetical protein